MIQEKLEQFGIVLPAAPKPVAHYVPARLVGNLMFISGQIPVMNGKIAFCGKVNRELDMEQGREAARLCVVNALAVLKQELGDLDRIKSIVRLEVFVNSMPGFTEQSQVANGASELLNELFADGPGHARIAVGASDLPLGSAVEVALIVELNT